jgi:hypothetical protein
MCVLSESKRRRARIMSFPETGIWSFMFAWSHQYQGRRKTMAGGLAKVLEHYMNVSIILQGMRDLRSSLSIQKHSHELCICRASSSKILVALSMTPPIRGCELQKHQIMTSYRYCPIKRVMAVEVWVVVL